MGLVEGERTLPEPQITLHGIHLSGHVHRVEPLLRMLQMSRIESLPRFQPMPRSALQPTPSPAR